MSRLRFLTLLILVGAMTSGVLMGQDKKEDKSEPSIVNVRLPRYFSKLSLTDKQKKEVLRIRATYSLKAAELDRKLKALRTQEAEEMDKVLTAAQKARLRELMPAGPASEKEATSEKQTEFKKPVAEKKK